MKSKYDEPVLQIGAISVYHTGKCLFTGRKQFLNRILEMKKVAPTLYA